MSEAEGSQQAPSGLPRRAPVVARLGIVEQLLGDLETATHGGQGYTMAKIVGLLQDQTAESEHRLSELQRRSLKRSLDELGRERQRMLPDRVAFVLRARKIADVLSTC